MAWGFWLTPDEPPIPCRSISGWGQDFGGEGGRYSRPVEIGNDRNLS